MPTRPIFWRETVKTTDTKRGRDIIAAISIVGTLAIPPAFTPSLALADATALPTLVGCLGQNANDGEYDACVGVIADACIERVAKIDQAALSRIAALANCYENETKAWETLAERATESWHETAPPTFAVSVANVVSASQRYQMAKCAVFEDMQRYGANGMVQFASCRNEEAARLTIFIGYALD